MLCTVQHGMYTVSKCAAGPCCSSARLLASSVSRCAFQRVADIARPAAQHIIGQYYQFLRLGFSGYKRIISSCTVVAMHTAEKIEALGAFDVVSVRLPVHTDLGNQHCGNRPAL